MFKRIIGFAAKNIYTGKYTLGFFVIILFLLIYTMPVCANTYQTEIETTYKFSIDGTASTINKITLINKTTEKYYPSYKLSLKNISPYDIKIYDEYFEYDYDLIENPDEENLTIFFPDKILGKDAKRIFYLEYKLKDLAKRTGEVWEIVLPKTFENSQNILNSLSLEIPNSFGERAYIYPNPSTQEQLENLSVYKYDKIYKGERVVAVFGSFQIFSFTLKYHLNNDSSLRNKQQIALPPDTSYQRVSYEKIEPIPENVIVDPDGNWLAEYFLRPKESFEIVVSGSVQVFANPRTLLAPKTQNLANNLRSDTFWEVQDPNIVNISKTFDTTKEIYDFVIDQLEYDIDEEESSLQRHGALKTITNNNINNKCTEYTDLFIALARANGIPAREINGFAYSDNSESKPLSLVNDLLHSWPEYWDEEKGHWVQIDPTWADTSGQDYFDNFDLKHIAFVIHGEDSQLPLSAGLYKSDGSKDKDIFVNFGQPQESFSEHINVILINKFPDLSRNINFMLSNKGKNAVYDMAVEIYHESENVNSEILSVVPPYSNIEIESNLPYSFFAKNTPSTITMFLNNRIFTFYDFKNYEIMMHVLVLLMLLTVLSCIIVSRRKNKKP